MTAFGNRLSRPLTTERGYELPAGMLPDSRVLDASPHKVTAQQTIEIARDFEFVVLFTSTAGFESDLRNYSLPGAILRHLGIQSVRLLSNNPDKVRALEEAGVKVARITGLADDLCLAMAAESILIERMPGKSTVGIQVPNHERETQRCEVASVWHWSRSSASHSSHRQPPRQPANTPGTTRPARSWS